ncbi:MAG TPA: UDP-N-acetylmuramate--L-alanine ligase [Phycisphaerales bacterium]|nr:UDP-N-acetylmuramate--L-alanine ligase [Phycisphaerales bacterium]
MIPQPDRSFDGAGARPPVTLRLANDDLPSASPTLPPAEMLPDMPPRRDRPGTFQIAGKRVYLVGIGGCGMSGLARMLRARGALVSGSDKESSDTTEALAREGVVVSLDQQTGRIPAGTQLVIASAAVPPAHPELLAAQHAGVEVLTYAQALGLCMIGRTGVAVAGTHGKSTISAMLGHTLIQCGLDPSVIVGATCAHLADSGGEPSGFRLGSERIPHGPRAGEPGVLVAEACEFNRSFHNLHPTLGAITSVEADHLDIYGSLDAVVASFREFARLVPPRDEGGYLLIAHDGAHRREVTAGLDCAVQTIGFDPSADWQVTYDASSRRVGLNQGARHLGNWVNRIPGAHIAIDSGFAAVLALRLGASMERIAAALASFNGVDRRMQFLGEKSIGDGAPVRVYDDYGHHPTEIDCTLRALRESERPEHRGGRLICVFQPHQHSRTRFLLEEFAQSFSHADVVIVPQIYFVRDSEVEKTRVSSADLVDRLRSRGVQAMHLHPFEAIVEQLGVICRPGDLLVVMGAGPVWRVARGFLDGASSGRG